MAAGAIAGDVGIGNEAGLIIETGSNTESAAAEAGLLWM